MIVLRIFLATFLLAMATYTAVVVAQYGLNLFPPFFGAIYAMTWQGQFNLDFLGFLVLSATWVAWRNEFTPRAMGLSILAFFGGMIFCPSIYCICLKPFPVESYQCCWVQRDLPNCGKVNNSHDRA